MQITKNKEYYLHIDNKNEGPYSFEQIKNFLNNKRINFTTYIYHEGLQDWTNLGELDEFSNRKIAIPPPPLPPIPFEETNIHSKEEIKEWVLLIKNTQKGPTTIKRITELLEQNKLRQSTLARKVNQTSWKRLNEMEEFSLYFSKKIEKAVGTPPPLTSNQQKTQPVANVKIILCESCKEEISFDARNCPKCGAVNNWIHPKIHNFMNQTSNKCSFEFHYKYGKNWVEGYTLKQTWYKPWLCPWKYLFLNIFFYLFYFALLSPLRFSALGALIGVINSFFIIPFSLVSIPLFLMVHYLNKFSDHEPMGDIDRAFMIVYPFSNSNSFEWQDNDNSLWHPVKKSFETCLPSSKDNLDANC